MKPLFSLDVETSGELPEYALQPWRVRQGKSWCTTIAWTVRDADGLIQTDGAILQSGDNVEPEKTERVLRHVLMLALNGGYRVTGWNNTFDIAWLLAYGLKDVVFRIDWIDAMRLWKHLTATPTFKGKGSWTLDNANRSFEPAYVDYKHEGGELYHDSRPEARQRLLAYNRSDTEATLLHTERFWPQLTVRQQRAALIEASCLPIVAEANVTGMRVDLKAREILSNTLFDVSNAVAAKMAPLGVTEAIVRSPARTATLLYKKWQLPVIKTTVDSKGVDTNKPSTDKEVLHELAADDERVLWLGQWREALNLRGKFMTGLLKSVEYNGEGDRTYPQAVVYATYTSRMTYGSKQGRGQNERHVGFALHQMKRDARFRNCIVADDDDHDIVELDAAGQEFRWMAIKSGDETMLSLCMPGGDAHTFMGAQIYGEDYDWLKAEKKAKAPHVKKKRELGKFSNLSLQYRTSKKKLRVVARVQHNLQMTPDQAAHIWTIYRQSYPGVLDYWREQIQLGKRVGYAETLAGRRVAVEGDWAGEHKWAMESTMINHPIQGTGGEQKYLAMRCLKNIMTEYNVRFGWDLHDGLYFMVPKPKTMAFATRAKHVLDNLPYKRAWDFTPPIPLPFDCKIGTAWGNLQEVEL